MFTQKHPNAILRLARLGPVLLVLLAACQPARGDLATFSDTGALSGVDQHNNRTDPGFTSGGQFFNNTYDPSIDAWSGWSVSSETDTRTPGYLNQYSAITGSGHGDADYAVAYAFSPNDAYINLSGDPLSVDFTNTTYAYLSMLNGDQFAKKFRQGDYFKFHLDGFSGTNGTGIDLGSVTGTLADYASDNDHPLDRWASLDLSPLHGARSLSLSFVSSDTGPFGINTPSYVAFDNLRVVAVPEPSSLALVAVGLLGLMALGRERRRTAVRLGAFLTLVATAGVSRADFDPQVGQPGSLGISKDSPVFTEWASSVVSITRGPVDITNPGGPLASFGDPANALGKADGTSSHVVSLGDGGSITLAFPTPIENGPGADFAVFENGFLAGPPGSELAYLELGAVDVSSDGVHFFRFPPVSLTQTSTQVGSFDLLDARNLHNLAGKYIAGYGTGFDLSDLAGVSPALDINHVIEVRITDVVGSIDPRYGTRDSLGNLINDPFKTPFASGGFDLNGVGVIHPAAAPEPSGLVLGLLGALGLGLARRPRRPARG